MEQTPRYRASACPNNHITLKIFVPSAVLEVEDEDKTPLPLYIARDGSQTQVVSSFGLLLVFPVPTIYLIQQNTRNNLPLARLCFLQRVGVELSSGPTTAHHSVRKNKQRFHNNINIRAFLTYTDRVVVHRLKSATLDCPMTDQSSP